CRGLAPVVRRCTRYRARTPLFSPDNPCIPDDACTPSAGRGCVSRGGRQPRAASAEGGGDPEDGEQRGGVRHERRSWVGHGGGDDVRSLPPGVGHLAIVEPDVAVP